MKYLEIGCAPGLTLAYACQLGARVCGLDYAAVGIERTRRLFDHLDLHASLYCEDVFHTTLPRNSFDVVHSGGVIEHFEDARELVRIHVQLLKPGGVALITLPHFGGIYGRIAAKTDPDNLAIHNTRIMSPDALKKLAPADLCASVEAFESGSMSLSAVSFRNKFFGLGAKFVFNLLGLAQPTRMRALCPTLVLRMVRGQLAQSDETSEPEASGRRA